MNSHKNAPLTRFGRVHLMQQITRMGLEAAAAQAEISKRRACIWRGHWNESGETGLCDRSSRPALSLGQIQPDKQGRIIALRRNHRLVYAQIVRRLGLSVVTVGHICSQVDVAKLPPVQALPPARRYERQTPGEILHLDMKKLARALSVPAIGSPEIPPGSPAPPGIMPCMWPSMITQEPDSAKFCQTRLSQASSPSPWKLYVTTALWT